MEKNNSGLTTVLLVLIILIFIGGLVWFFLGQREQMSDQPESELNIDLKIPDDISEGEGTN